jgi:hypothetical protein
VLCWQRRVYQAVCCNIAAFAVKHRRLWPESDPCEKVHPCRCARGWGWQIHRQLVNQPSFAAAGLGVATPGLAVIRRVAVACSAEEAPSGCCRALVAAPVKEQRPRPRSTNQVRMHVLLSWRRAVCAELFIGRSRVDRLSSEFVVRKIAPQGRKNRGQSQCAAQVA